MRVISVGRRHPVEIVDEHWEADLRKMSDIHRVLSKMEKNLNISVLINNAGAMLGVNDEESIMLHFRAPMMLMGAMADVKKGHIINIASVSGIKGEAEFPVYAACKAALINLTKSYAKLYAGEITVNAISPGFFSTNLFPNPTPIDMIRKGTLMGYEADVKNILPAVDMLLKSPYVTGTNVIVDGGALRV
jgi:NAD(P)-dependent dehydrogenase (short-subunit alcohol dehydrogenase family)